ncbi:hypothetical protein BC952_1127 [Flavobacterium limicola]|uniref:Uncharacterized protein n=1 Tax=Flavobacterium limicola TaxID=180441 RepID=A0A495S6F8_9FLAO|nr:hypothetical protein BC952_1127 [Flavobacterium limicola]
MVFLILQVFLLIILGYESFGTKNLQQEIKR